MTDFVSTDELYKGHTHHLDHDIAFYSNFIDGKRALEMFAGYGRVTNRLIAKGHDLETVELLPQYAQCIDLPASKNHVCNVLDFVASQPYERIFVAADSFTLLTKDSDIQIFFSMISDSLVVGGQVALNVYHPDYWDTAIAYDFDLGEKKVQYTPDYDLTSRHIDKTALWFDRYECQGQQSHIRYEIRVYEDENDFLPFTESVGLQLKRRADNFDLDSVFEPGWQDYIFEKIN